MKVETPLENLLFSKISVQASGSDGSSVGTGFVFAYEQGGGKKMVKTNPLGALAAAGGR